MSLGPVSRFPLGLLDLFGVKQNGTYPRDVAEQMVPTIEVLRLVVSANATSFRAIPINIAGAGAVAAGYQGTNGLLAAQNEALFITNWSVSGNVVGVAAELPDFNFALVNPNGADNFMLNSATGRDPVIGTAATRYLSKGQQGLWYVPPGWSTAILTHGSAIGVAAGLCQIEYNVRYLRVRI
jgi:hypothetical protein